MKKTATKTPFDFESFRIDINNNEKFETFKTKYSFKTRQELDLQLLKLMRLDNQFYEYRSDQASRIIAVYESKDGFIKIHNTKVEEFKSSLGLEELKFSDVRLDGNQIIIEIKAAQHLKVMPKKRVP